MKTELNPTFSQRLRVRLLGQAYIGHRRNPGWKEALPFYLFKCCKHGYQVSRPSGYNQNLICSECFREKHPEDIELLESLEVVI